MQKLRNLRLAVRLGIAFGALGLGLLVVSVVAFKSTGNLDTKVKALAVDVPAVHRDRRRHRRAHAPGVPPRRAAPLRPRRRPQGPGRGRQAVRGARRAGREGLRGHARDPRRRRRTPRRGPRPTASRSCATATSGCSASRARRSRPRARRPSRTSRSASPRARCTRSRSSSCRSRSAPASRRAPRAPLAYAAGEGKKASDAIAATKRAILIAALLSVLDRARARRSSSRARSRAPCTSSSSGWSRSTSAISRRSRPAWRPAPTVT